MSAKPEAEIFGAQMLYREWGRRFTVLQQYLKGIHYYEKSTSYEENEHFLWTLLGLSVALKKSGQFKEAAEVAEKCMRIDPHHLGANWTRMEALFDVAEFGASLACAYRGARRRRSYRQAVLLGNETIENSIGDNLPRNILRQLHPWILSLRAHREELLKHLNDEEDEFEGIDEEVVSFKVSDPEARLRQHREQHDHLLSSLYFGPSTADDRYFLKTLRVHPAVTGSINKAGKAQIEAKTEDCVTRLRSQQEAIRMGRPLYSIRAKAQGALTLGHKLAIAREEEYRACLLRNEAKFILRQLHEARLRRDYPTFFKMVERAKEKFESHRPGLFPERRKYLETLYHMVARVYIDPRNLTRFCKEHEQSTKEAHLRRALGLMKGQMALPRDSDLAWLPTLDAKRAFDGYRERLALASQRSEILWLFHEVAKLFLEIRRYDLARFYTKKLRDLSAEAGQEDWVLNATHILLRIELAQHNRNEAKETGVEALESARKLKVHFLVDFYEQAIAYIEDLDFGKLREKDTIAIRRKLMISLAPGELRPRMDLLLKKMEAVPASRRLSVMPGCKPQDLGEKATSKRQTVGPPIPPDFRKQAVDDLLRKFAPSKKIPGFVDFQEYD